MKHAKKHISLALSGAMLAGCLTWGTVSFASKNHALAADKRSSLPNDTLVQEQASEATGLVPSTASENSTEYWKELFKIYEPFGITYDAAKNELRYHGKLVRCFEDYYPLDDSGNIATGTDFFQENGVTDVYAIRDLDHIERNGDGSYDPSGTLTGLGEASKEEFAARDIGAIKNPQAVEAAATSEDALSAEEMMELAAEYIPFGVTYDLATDRWFFHGEQVRRFEDILLSNNEAPGSGNFSGCLRSSYDDNGTVDIYTVRDFTKRNDDGYGTLTGIEKK